MHYKSSITIRIFSSSQGYAVCIRVIIGMNDSNIYCLSSFYVPIYIDKLIKFYAQNNLNFIEMEK